MKKEYKDLELEVVDFKDGDVITASGNPACKLLDCTAILTPCPFEVICECNKALECAYSPSM